MGQGKTGKQGEIGPMGLMGPMGPMGTMGPIGTMGPMGLGLTFSDLTIEEKMQLVGTMGPMGTMGPLGPSFNSPEGIQYLENNVVMYETSGNVNVKSEDTYFGGNNNRWMFHFPNNQNGYGHFTPIEANTGKREWNKVVTLSRRGDLGSQGRVTSRYTQIPYMNNNNTLRTMANVRISECIDACNQNKDCIGFSVPSTTNQQLFADVTNSPTARGTCTLKSTFNDRIPNDNFHMYARNKFN